MQFVQIFVKFMTLQIVPCNDKIFSRHAGSFVGHHTTQCFLLCRQSSKFAVVPSFVSHRTTDQLILFGTHAMSFCWKLWPLWSQAALTYSLLYFWLQMCHRIIQYSSALLSQRQWAIKMNLSHIDYWSQQGNRQVDCQTDQPVVIWYPFLPSLLFDCLLSDSWIDVL